MYAEISYRYVRRDYEALETTCSIEGGFNEFVISHFRQVQLHGIPS